MAAGLATLRRLTPELYSRLEDFGSVLEAGLKDAAHEADVSAQVVRAGSMLTVFFDDNARFARFFAAMLERRVMLPPSQQEAWFISAAHGNAELRATLVAARASFREVLA